MIVVFLFRYCPQNVIPSGKTRNDMLTLVRRDAFAQRATSKTKDDTEDGADGAHEEQWQTWYPQEWIGWVLFGAPSEEPKKAWVTQSISEGPEIALDEASKAQSAKRPYGRNVQRERETASKTTSKQASDILTLQSSHIMQVDQELEMNKRLHDLATISMMEEVAINNEERVSQHLFNRHLIYSN